MRELSKIEFACAADAVAAAHCLSKQLKYHSLTQISGRQVTVKPDAKLLVRSPERSGSNLRFKVQAQLELDASVIGKEIKASGKFILATNVLEAKQLNPDDMIVK